MEETNKRKRGSVNQSISEALTITIPRLKGENERLKEQKAQLIQAVTDMEKLFYIKCGYGKLTPEEYKIVDSVLKTVEQIKNK